MLELTLNHETNKKKQKERKSCRLSVEKNDVAVNLNLVLGLFLGAFHGACIKL